MPKMTPAEREAFLADMHVAVFSITDEGRGPLAMPIWYGYTPGGEVWVWTDTTSRKAKLLEVGTRVSFCVQKETPPYQYVTVEGPVSAIVSARTEDIRMLAERYLGPEAGEPYIASLEGGAASETDIIVRVQLERWHSWRFDDE